MSRRVLAFSLLACAPVPLAAQGNPLEVPAGACTEASPPQGFRASFNSSADNVRVLLCGGVKYLAETNRAGAQRLQLRPVSGGVQSPQIREGMMGPQIEGGRSWIIDVGTTGIFDVQVQGSYGGIPVDLTVTPRVDNSRQKAQKEQEKAARKAQEDSAKAAKKAADEQRKAEEKAAKEAEKARKEAEKQAKAAAGTP
jgi:hypothetical protein